MDKLEEIVKTARDSHFCIQEDSETAVNALEAALKESQAKVATMRGLLISMSQWQQSGTHLDSFDMRAWVDLAEKCISATGEDNA